MFKLNKCHFLWPCLALLALVKLNAVTYGSSGHELSVMLMNLGQNFHFHPRCTEASGVSRLQKLLAQQEFLTLHDVCLFLILVSPCLTGKGPVPESFFCDFLVLLS